MSCLPLKHLTINEHLNMKTLKRMNIFISPVKRQQQKHQQSDNNTIYKSIN